MSFETIQESAHSLVSSATEISENRKGLCQMKGGVELPY